MNKQESELSIVNDIINNFDSEVDLLDDVVLLPEGKLGASNRLKSAGLWMEASQFRDICRQKFRENKKTVRYCKELAWLAMMRKYPEKEYSQPTMDVPQVDVADRNVDLREDIMWVYLNMEVMNAEAPHPGAAAMLTWARKNRDRFFETMLNKILRYSDMSSAGKKGKGKQGPRGLGIEYDDLVRRFQE